MHPGSIIGLYLDVNQNTYKGRDFKYSSERETHILLVSPLQSDMSLRNTVLSLQRGSCITLTTVAVLVPYMDYDPTAPQVSLSVVLLLK